MNKDRKSQRKELLDDFKDIMLALPSAILTYVNYVVLQEIGLKEDCYWLYCVAMAICVIVFTMFGLGVMIVVVELFKYIFMKKEVKYEEKD